MDRSSLQTPLDGNSVFLVAKLEFLVFAVLAAFSNLDTELYKLLISMIAIPYLTLYVSQLVADFGSSLFSSLIVIIMLQACLISSMILIDSIFATPIFINQPQCTSDTCKNAARFIRQAINPYVSPCDDFYDYACGGWLQRNLLPETKPSYSTAIEASDLMYDQIKTLLQSPQIGQHPSRSIRLAKFIYDQCLIMGNDLDNDSELIKSLLHINQKRPQSSKVSDRLDTWHEIYMDQNPIVQSLFEIEVIANPRNQSETILSIDSVEFDVNDDLLRKFPQNDSKTLIAYHQYLENILELLPDDHSKNSTNLINQILRIENRLANFKMSAVDRRNPSKVINIITYREFNNRTNFDWLENIIKPTFAKFQISIDHHIDDNLLVTDVDYFTELIDYLSNDVPKELLEKYFHLKIVQELVPFLGERYRNFLYDFLKIKSGVKTTPERWRTCYNQVEKLLPWALSRLYVDNHLKSNDLNQARMIIDQIHQAFIKMVESDKESGSWMDMSVRKLALQKLHHIRKNVAYPDWLLDDKQLDLAHNWDQEILDPSPENYLKELDQLKWKQMEANLKILQIKSFDRTDTNYLSWPMEPARVNAAYSPEDNAITIPAGILNPPFFHADYPMSMNFGGIGAVVGHELTHSLDDEGRQFDHEGIFHQDDWWNEDQLEKFDQRSKCLVEQYSEIEESCTKIALDGNRTLGENIADNGGLRQAFLAFQHQKMNFPEKAGQILADLPEYSPEQLFFISNAQIWCTTVRPETMRAKIHSDPHVPAKYRVNVPVSNSDDFARAFRCPKGTNMNPFHKCILW